MLVTHANMKGLGRTPSLGDRRGFMPPQLKTNKVWDTPFVGLVDEFNWKKLIGQFVWTNLCLFLIEEA